MDAIFKAESAGMDGLVKEGLDWIPCPAGLHCMGSTWTSVWTDGHSSIISSVEIVDVAHCPLNS